MKHISLNGKWKIHGRREGKENDTPIILEGTVPGCVQLDMCRAGLLPEDIYMGMNITETEKYEGHEWWYEKSFTAPEERKNVYLVFRGVDCIAEYFLNGKKFGESDNMFIPHEFEIGGYLRDGENTLTVHLKSPVKHLHNTDYDITSVAISWMGSSSTPIRRAPHSYGWDIMPRAVTSGLWREVFIEVRDDISFSQAFFDYRRGRLNFCYTTASHWEDFHDVEIEVEATCGDSRIYSRFRANQPIGRVTLPLSSPKLWWPKGYGESNVYDASLRIFRAGEPIHETKTQFGIKTVELKRTDVTDGKTGCFKFIINGEEVMCRGSNWVPMDAFHCRDAERYDAALALAEDCGCNILRCWGGNVYEDHKFFDFCDRHGIMVWQDFAMACGYYPQNEEFFDKIRKEATSVIREYRHHPSIILWSGDNEIDSMMEHNRLRPSNNRINREVLPAVVANNDPSRPYLASSPYISDQAFDKTANISAPEEHLWGSRDYHKSDFHKHSKYHFVSETGYHGCPGLESIKKFITPDRVWSYRNNPEWTLHSSDQNGNDSRVMLMEYQVRQMFGFVPENAEDYILASQISQAEAKKYFIERMRVGRPQKSGIIWWNLLDGWPQMSDAVVDYYYSKKLAYYYIKRSQKPFIIALDELYDRMQKVCACNDTLKDIAGKVKITDSESGKVVFEREFIAKRNTSTVIGSIPCEYHEHKLFIIEWCADGEQGFNHYTTGFIPYSLDKYKEWIKKYKLDT